MTDLGKRWYIQVLPNGPRYHGVVFGRHSPGATGAVPNPNLVAILPCGMDGTPAYNGIE